MLLAVRACVCRLASPDPDAAVPGPGQVVCGLRQYIQQGANHQGHLSEMSVREAWHARMPRRHAVLLRAAATRRWQPSPTRRSTAAACSTDAAPRSAARCCRACSRWCSATCAAARRPPPAAAAPPTGPRLLPSCRRAARPAHGLRSDVTHPQAGGLRMSGLLDAALTQRVCRSRSWVSWRPGASRRPTSESSASSGRRRGRAA